MIHFLNKSIMNIEQGISNIERCDIHHSLFGVRYSGVIQGNKRLLFFFRDK